MNTTPSPNEKADVVAKNLPPRLLAFARELRRNQTKPEAQLWEVLRNRRLNNWKFRRQHPISDGFILDFFCAQTMVAIELDGPGHQLERQLDYDLNRTKILTDYGIKVIRFTNEEIRNDFENVIHKLIEFSTSHP